MAVAAERQLGVLLALLRNLGSWQGVFCHDSRFRNAAVARIATTPDSTTPADGGMAARTRYSSLLANSR